MTDSASVHQNLDFFNPFLRLQMHWCPCINTCTTVLKSRHYDGRTRARIGENHEKAMTADDGNPATNRVPATSGNPNIAASVDKLIEYGWGCEGEVKDEAESSITSE